MPSAPLDTVHGRVAGLRRPGQGRTWSSSLSNPVTTPTDVAVSRTAWHHQFICLLGGTSPRRCERRTSTPPHTQTPWTGKQHRAAWCDAQLPPAVLYTRLRYRQRCGPGCSDGSHSAPHDPRPALGPGRPHASWRLLLDGRAVA